MACLVVTHSPTRARAQVGPSSLLALLVLGAVEPLAARGSERYTELVMFLAFISGLTLAAMFFARAGYLVNFLSHPVLKGFSLAAAFITACSQLGSLMGFRAVASSGVFTVLQDVVSKTGLVNGTTLGLGAANLVLLPLLQWGKKHIPRGSLLPTPIFVRVAGRGGTVPCVTWWLARHPPRSSRSTSLS